MLGVNLGTLGFLTDADRHDGIAAIERAADGDSRVEKRMMLGVSCGGNETRALNDVYITRGDAARLAAFSVAVNGAHMDTLRADGLIISTPTGSTAYNLSAGGPILLPDAAMLVLTPVCPHTLYTRPWVLSADDVVTVTNADARAELAVYPDGEYAFALEEGASVAIKRSPLCASIVKTSGASFFGILRQKMVEAI
jgi:NAD+ kinase